MNSVSYDQINGEKLTAEELESVCGSKTYADESKSKILVPCGYIANSFFNGRIDKELKIVSFHISFFIDKYIIL